MRQDNVRDEVKYTDQRSPKQKRTFGDAKQALPEYDDMNQMNVYSDTMYNSDNNAFIEADEDDPYGDGSTPQYQPNPYYGHTSEPKLPFEEDEYAHQDRIRRSAENYMGEPQYSSPEESTAWHGRKERPYRRRSSRELPENEVMLANEQDDPHRRKPESMRSISEDTPTRSAKQPVTRRTLSHPEQDTYSQYSQVEFALAPLL